MALDKLKKSKIKAWVQENNGSYDAVIELLAEYLRKTDAEEITGQNAFESLRQLHTNQGKVAGLKEFFDSLEKLNFE